MKEVLYVGIDVDDKAFHIAGHNLTTGEVLEGACKPTKGALLKKLERWQKQGYELETCYEATYIGFSLHRYLVEKGINNSVIAPSLIPEKASDRVKTDRLDSQKLALYLAKGLLTKIYVPTEEDESRRDLLRSRSFIVQLRSDLKRHILSTVRRLGLDYKSESGGKHYWTKSHVAWLEKSLKKIESCARTNLELLLTQFESLNDQIGMYDDEIGKISDEEKYKSKVEALSCFKGISTVTALTLITEIGDVRRFPHPTKLTSYAGLDIREYSSGGREMKYGITKMGNRRIRTAVVEACQVPMTRIYVSRRLKAARNGQPKEVVAVAEKCMRRLRKKTEALKLRNKPNNKIKVACARELLSFTWEVLTKVA